MLKRSKTTIFSIPPSGRATAPFLERPGYNLAHRPVNFASLTDISFHHFQNYRNFDLECKPGHHNSAFRARKVTGTFEKRSPDPKVASVYFIHVTNRFANCRRQRWKQRGPGIQRAHPKSRKIDIYKARIEIYQSQLYKPSNQMGGVSCFVDEE